MSDESDADADADAGGGIGAGDRGGVFHDVAVGETRATRGRTITEADVVNFAGVSGDFNHLHTDGARMADSTYGERIAHGMLVLSVATGLVWQNRSDAEREAVVALYGIDRLRFLAPVFIGDRIHVELEVTDKTERDRGPGTGTVRYGCEVVCNREDPAVACELVSLLE